MVEFPAFSDQGKALTPPKWDSYWSRWYCFYVLHDLVFCNFSISWTDLTFWFATIILWNKRWKKNWSRWSEVSAYIWCVWCQSQTNSGFCQLCLLFCPFHKHWLEKRITQNTLRTHLRCPSTYQYATLLLSPASGFGGNFLVGEYVVNVIADSLRGVTSTCPTG